MSDNPYTPEPEAAYDTGYEIGQDNVEMMGPEHAATSAPSYFNNRKLSIFGGSNEIQKNIIAKVKMGGRA